MFPAKLLKNTGIDLSGVEDQPILGLSADSRSVLPGYLFAAIDGTQAKGSDFVGDAVARGAQIILAGDQLSLEGVSVLTHQNPRLALAICARNFFEFAPKCVAAITGTNGKTSVATLVRQLWSMSQLRSASIGTLGVEADGYCLPLQNTTPDPVQLHAILRDLTFLGVEHCILEASSHGLDQCRVDGVHVQVAGFTNLTHDHLDYHADLESYFQAKARLFEDVLSADGVGVVDISSVQGQRIAEIVRKRGIKLITCGSTDADIYVQGLMGHAHGQDVKIHYAGDELDLFLPLVGSFQCQNLGVALGIAQASGLTMPHLLSSLPGLSAPRGRMEYVGKTNRGAHVYVDYAHTPDALARAMATLKDTTGGALWVVFGCGGDRDQSKRIEMGQAAQDGADHIIVTDDNPRFEDPASIRAMVISGCRDAIEVADRGAAIALALDQAKNDSIILIAGKGHEGGQVINGHVHPFDDVQCARAHILKAEGDHA